MTKACFRILIICYVVSLVATAVDTQYFPAQVSAELAAVYATDALPPFVDNPAIFLTFAVVSLIVIIVPPVALFFFRKWGRGLAGFATIIMLAMLPFLGPSLSSGIGMALMQLAATLWGAILALAYFSPLNSDFR